MRKQAVANNARACEENRRAARKNAHAQKPKITKSARRLAGTELPEKHAIATGAAP